MPFLQVLRVYYEGEHLFIYDSWECDDLTIVGVSYKYINTSHLGLMRRMF